MIEILKIICTNEKNIDLFNSKNGVEIITIFLTDPNSSLDLLCATANLIDKFAYNDKIAL